MSVKKVYLIRHGETDYNRDGRLQGTMPVPLNYSGRLQAQALGLYLKQQAIEAIFSSPLSRARETADLIGQVINIPIQDDSRLAEIAFGKFEGLTHPQIKQQYEDEYRMWRSGDMEYVVPDGESRRAVQQRMAQAWGDITARNEFNTVAIVSHGSALKILLKHLFYKLPADMIANTSATTLTRYQHIWEIEAFAETPHLAD